jgi:cytosine/adenosine deaminase-related metal-dependent hydrolase
VSERHAATRRDQPFLVHLAEGTDERARGELARLEALGCLTENTVLVHGVALTDDDFARVVASRAKVVWCPSSTLAMFGCTAPIGRWVSRVPGWLCQISLGTDSRLTGSRDLLEELKVAARLQPQLRGDLLATVTTNAARALHLASAGAIAIGAPSDFSVFPSAPDPSAALLQSSRRDVALVVIDGRPLIGKPALRAVFDARRVVTGSVSVDGVSLLAAQELVRAAESLPEGEPGVETMRCA